MIPNTPSDIPSINTLIGLSNGAYPKRYMSLHDLGTGSINPLQNVIPTFDLPTVDYPRFFGTYVLNFLGLTGPYLNGDGGWDDFSHSKEILIASYPKFARYELHMFMDMDSPPMLDADVGQIADTNDLLAELAGELEDYGVEYHGQLGSGAVSTLLTITIANFYSWIKENG